MDELGELLATQERQTATTTELFEEIAWFEGRATLTASEFERYFQAETQLEAQLIDAAVFHAQNLDFTSSCDIIKQVVELNIVLRSIIARELERLSAEETEDVAQRDTLVHARGLTEGTILQMQGMELEYLAERYTASSDVTNAIQALERALEYFRSLASSELPQANLGQLRAALTETSLDFLNALFSLRAARYDTARDGFVQTRVKYRLILDELEEETPSDPSEESLRNQLFIELNDRHTYSRVLISITSSFSEIYRSEFKNASMYAEDAVKLGEQWSQRAVGDGLPAVVQGIRRQELSLYRGWLAWIQAEYAVDERRWDDCRSLIHEARRHWNDSSELALRNRLLGVLSGQNEIGSMELLLLATLRRNRREEELREEIDRLRREKREIGPTIVNAYGGTMSSGDTSNYNIGGSVNANAFGTNSAAHNSTSSSQHTEIAAGDFRGLVTELASLREAISAGARSDNEQATVEHLRQAEELARRGDERGMREHLRAAGNWALSFAEKLALTTAEAALKMSIGA